MSANMPDITENVLLHNLVEKFQIHSHSKSCRKYNKNECRFGFGHFFCTRTIIAEPLKIVFKKIIDSVPLLKFVYTALNDLFSAFVGKEKKFSKPVLVKVNTISDLEKLGFITEENLEILDELDKVAVYFPHSYNFSGELFIVPKKNIKPLSVNSSQVMKFIVSAGLTGWDKEEK